MNYVEKTKSSEDWIAPRQSQKIDTKIKNMLVWGNANCKGMY